MTAQMTENPLPGSTTAKPYEHPVIFEAMCREADPASVLDARDLESWEVAILAEAYAQKKNVLNTCHVCNGAGIIDGGDMREDETCYRCRGNGYVPLPIPPETEEEFIHYEKIDKDYHSATDPFDGVL